MQRIVITLIILLLTGLLFSCSPSKHHDTFTGTIEIIEEQNAIVYIEDGNILSSGQRVSVNLSVSDNTSFQIGDKVKVSYEGDIRESEPLGIDTVFVELIGGNEGNSTDTDLNNASFTGTIQEIIGNSAIVYNGKGDIIVNLSVNKHETFAVGDDIYVEYDGTIMESDPAKINTLFIKLLD